MSEQNDKRLHKWVRESMDTYRPPFDPADWARMQRLLQRRRWWRRGIAGIVSIGLIGLLGWLLPYQPATKTVATLPSKRPVATSSAEPANAPYAASNQLPSTNPARNPTHPVLHSRNPIVSEQSMTRLPFQTPDELTVSTKITTLSTRLTANIQRREPVAYSTEETGITQQLLTGNFGPDSTAYQTLSRNIQQWPDAVIVCDLTTSMYPYTTQLFTWFKQNARSPSVKGAVFFTDCDSLGQQTQPGGPPGRMFVASELYSASVLPTLISAARNTVRNIDDAENNVEALLFAQCRFPDAKHLILIADNLSTVKDMALLNGVKKPVHVVLCGTTGSDATLPFQADYARIARQTGGSLHTLEDDLNPAQLSRNTILQVGPHYYRYSTRKKQFKLTSFDHRPKKLLNLIWF